MRATTKVEIIKHFGVQFVSFFHNFTYIYVYMFKTLKIFHLLTYCMFLCVQVPEHIPRHTCGSQRQHVCRSWFSHHGDGGDQI